MLPILSLTWFERYASATATDVEVSSIVEKYSLHEIVAQDLMEKNTQAKMDVYDDRIFLVVHFPKYNSKNDKYLINEFNIILGKGLLVMLSTYVSTHITTIKNEFAELVANDDTNDAFKISPYYVLYKFFDVMYDKVLLWNKFFTQDIARLEEDLFDTPWLDLKLLESIMIKKRNLVALKHMITPHEEIIQELHTETIKLFKGQFDVYFEDLAYKIDKIESVLSIQSENLDSLYDTYNTMVNMRTNRVITILTVFTALLWILTLVTWFYGMNVPLPWGESSYTVYWILGWVIAWMILFVLRMLRGRRV